MRRLRDKDFTRECNGAVHKRRRNNSLHLSMTASALEVPIAPSAIAVRVRFGRP